MDNLVKTLFKDGVNNGGDITIRCTGEPSAFTCHLFVLERFSTVLTTHYKWSLTKNVESGEPRILTLEFPARIVKFLVATMYDSTYGGTINAEGNVVTKDEERFKKHFQSIQDYVDYVKLVDYCNGTTTHGEIIVGHFFKLYLTLDNWKDALDVIPDISIYTLLRNVVYNFVLRNVLTLKILKQGDPFVKVDPSAYYYKSLIDLYRQKMVNLLTAQDMKAPFISVQKCVHARIKSKCTVCKTPHA
jgi:hypothetical protein